MAAVVIIEGPTAVNADECIGAASTSRTEQRRRGMGGEEGMLHPLLLVVCCLAVLLLLCCAVCFSPRGLRGRMDGDCQRFKFGGTSRRKTKIQPKAGENQAESSCKFCP